MVTWVRAVTVKVARAVVTAAAEMVAPEVTSVATPIAVSVALVLTEVLLVSPGVMIAAVAVGLWRLVPVAPRLVTTIVMAVVM